MYCPECQCEYVGWTGNCPDCKTPLIEGEPKDLERVGQPISCEVLLDLIKEHDGQLRIDLSTVTIKKERKWTFPYFGYGYAWATKMAGRFNGFALNLNTVEVGKSKSRKFPYQGYGFAWQKRMLGEIGGNEVSLQVVKVSRERKWRFPHSGYGRAWTEEIAGDCGDQLKAHLSITEVGKGGAWRFPYRGYGFAWAKKSVLTLSIKD